MSTLKTKFLSPQRRGWVSDSLFHGPLFDGLCEAIFADRVPPHPPGGFADAPETRHERRGYGIGDPKSSKNEQPSMVTGFVTKI